MQAAAIPQTIRALTGTITVHANAAKRVNIDNAKIDPNSVCSLPKYLASVGKSPVSIWLIVNKNVKTKKLLPKEKCGINHVYISNANNMAAINKPQKKAVLATFAPVDI